MKKKYLLCIGATIVIAISVVLIKEKILEKNREIVRNAHEKLMYPRGEVEYVKVTKEDGSYEEYYKDTETKIEQTDKYNENNELDIREIFYMNEGKISSVYNENGKYEGSTQIQAPQIAKENKSLANISLMNMMSGTYITKYLSDDFKKVKNEDSSFDEYVSKTVKIYIDKNTETIAKVISIHPTRESEVIEFKKLKKGEKELFKIDSPNNSNVDLSNIKLKVHIQEDINYEDAKG